MSKTLSILHLEDDPNDALLIGKALLAQGVAAKVTTAGDRDSFVAALASGEFDLFLADYRLPGFDGAEALMLVRRRFPNTPFIFVTGAMGEERAIETIKLGATDYILKDRLNRLGVSISRALEEARIKAERHQAEQDLRVSEERLRLALEGGRMGLWELDLRTNAIIRNAKHSELLGLDIEDGPMTAEDFFSHVHPDDRAYLRAVTAEIVLKKSDLEAEFRVVRKSDGRICWLAARGKPVLDEAGNPERIIGVNYDITASRENEEALREAGRRKDEFLAMLAHELRNPLAAIRNASQLMLMAGIDNPAAQRGIDVIDRQIGSMARLLDDLLDVARVSQGKISLRPERQDLRVIVMQAVEVAQSTLSNRDVKLLLTQPMTPLWVQGDAVRIEQIITNLLNNAMRFTETGEIRVSLTQERRAAGNWIALKVADTGIGISQEMLPAIFDLFTQGEQNLGRSFGGLGIGLFMVRRLTEMHGGEVDVRSEGAGKGSTFIVRLPLLDGAAEVIPVKGARLAPVRSETDRPALRVMIVDDNQPAAQMLGEVLEGLGYCVSVVFSGAEAIRQSEQFKPRVILLDLGMPEMDGLETARRLRNNARMQSAKIIAMTGYGHEAMKIAAQQSGFNGYLLKPVDTASLNELLSGELRASTHSGEGAG